jgi:hypothetical protein
MQPGFGGKSAIKNMQHPASERLDAAQQQSGFQLALALSLWSTVAPPTHRRQAGNASLWLRSHQNDP